VMNLSRGGILKLKRIEKIREEKGCFSPSP
jgi:hypothetical protein